MSGSPSHRHHALKVKGKGFPYSLTSVGSGADPGVQAVSPQVTVSHPPGGRLPLLSARPVVTSPATEHHRPLAGTKLCCLVTEAHRCEQLAQGCYAALPQVLNLQPIDRKSNALPVAHGGSKTLLQQNTPFINCGHQLTHVDQYNHH